MANITTSHVSAADGTQLAVHHCGPSDGRAVLMLHGFFSDAQTNWIRYGHASLLAGAGFRVIMPDLRAHGSSGKPHGVAAYPPDILADDALGLIAQLGLSDYDLVGYSLGARTAARMLVRGARPRRVILSGMGFEGITNTGTRSAHFANILDNLGSFERGSAEWMAEAFLKTMNGDPLALRGIIDTFVDTSEAELAALQTPIAVICGEDDGDNGSAARLAEALPNAEYVVVPGNHMSAVAKAELGQAICDFLMRPA